MDPTHFGDWVTIHRKLGDVDDGPLRKGFKVEQTLCLHRANFKVHWTLAECDAPDHAVWEGKGPAGSHARDRRPPRRRTATAARASTTSTSSSAGRRLGPAGRRACWSAGCPSARRPSRSSSSRGCSRAADDGRSLLRAERRRRRAGARRAAAEPVRTPRCSTTSRPRSCRRAGRRPRALVFRAQGDVCRPASTCTSSTASTPPAPSRSTSGCWRSRTRSRTCRSRRSPSRHGMCLTAALELSLACDLLWAARGAQFGLVETVVGITPLMGGTQRIAERAGTARAREFVMTGRLYPAETLHEWGVVNRVLPAADLLDEVTRASRRGSPPGPTAGPRRHQADHARPGRPRDARRRRAHRRR